MTSTRIYGKALVLVINGEDHAPDIRECLLEHEDSSGDDLTFGDLSAGISPCKLSITAIQSTDPDSLWRTIWTHAGEEVNFRMAVHGNNTASATQPHVTGKVTIGVKPPLGGAADPKKSYEFKVEWSGKSDGDLVETGTATTP